MHILHVQQSFQDLVRPWSDPAFSRARVRKFLARHGFRGAALKAELDRITTGYSPLRSVEAVHGAESSPIAAVAHPDPAAVRIRYPYDWPKASMTRVMKRMFHGHGKRVGPPIFDEFWAAMGSLDGNANEQASGADAALLNPTLTSTHSARSRDWP